MKSRKNQLFKQTVDESSVDWMSIFNKKLEVHKIRQITASNAEFFRMIIQWIRNLMKRSGVKVNEKNKLHH